MGHINARGTFLIRESEQNPGGFALSIKDWEQDRSYHIKHYKIKPLDNNRGYYITTRQTFQTLPDLVKSYQTTAGESDKTGVHRADCDACRQGTVLPADQGLPEAGTQRGQEQRPGVCHQGPVRDPQVSDPADQEARGRQLRRGLERNLAEQSRRGSEDPQARHDVPGGFPTGQSLLLTADSWKLSLLYLQEAEIMKKFSHPHLVAMYAVCTEQEPFYIITE